MIDLRSYKSNTELCRRIRILKYEERTVLQSFLVDVGTGCIYLFLIFKVDGNWNNGHNNDNDKFNQAIHNIFHHSYTTSHHSNQKTTKATKCNHKDHKDREFTTTKPQTPPCLTTKTVRIQPKQSFRTPGLASVLQGSVNVHRGALLLVPKGQCISSFVFYFFVTLVPFVMWSW